MTKFSNRTLFLSMFSMLCIVVNLVIPPHPLGLVAVFIAAIFCMISSGIDFLRDKQIICAINGLLWAVIASLDLLTLMYKYVV